MSPDPLFLCTLALRTVLVKITDQVEWRPPPRKAGPTISFCKSIRSTYTSAVNNGTALTKKINGIYIGCRREQSIWISLRQHSQRAPFDASAQYDGCRWTHSILKQSHRRFSGRFAGRHSFNNRHILREEETIPRAGRILDRVGAPTARTAPRALPTTGLVCSFI